MDLDLLSLFPLNGGKNHGGMERNQALKRSTMEERELEEVENYWGRRPLKRGSKDRAIGGGKVAAPIAQPGWLGTRSGRPWPGLGWPNYRTIQNEYEHILIIRTPFSMFLDSLESPQRALQDYAEKHHSPSCEDKTK